MTPGDKIVCVDDQFPEVLRFLEGTSAFPDGLPVLNREYTVRDACVNPESGNRVVRLVGIRGCIHPETGVEMFFSVLRFRKVADTGRTRWKFWPNILVWLGLSRRP